VPPLLNLKPPQPRPAHTNTPPPTHLSVLPPPSSSSLLPPRMFVTTFFLLLLSWPLFDQVAVSSAHPNDAEPPRPLAARDSNSHSVPPLGFYDPRDHGGAWLTVRLNTSFPLPPPSSLSLLPVSGEATRENGRRLSIETTFSPSLRLGSQQYISSRPGRTHKRHHPRNVRRRGVG
jgi:hypothetical protein